MGGNGTFAKGAEIAIEARKYTTVYKIDDNTIVVQKKGKNAKLPEESHTAGRVYVAFEKDGSDVKGIAKYGDDKRKLWEIHTTDHRSLGEHLHPWKDGKPVDVRALTKSESELLNKIRKLQKLKKRKKRGFPVRPCSQMYRIFYGI